MLLIKPVVAEVVHPQRGGMEPIDFPVMAVMARLLP
jgi:hypothetical protein